MSQDFLGEFEQDLQEVYRLLSANRIFIDRTLNVSPIDAETALSYGFTGPNLRAAGADVPEVIVSSSRIGPGELLRMYTRSPRYTASSIESAS